MSDPKWLEEDRGLVIVYDGIPQGKTLSLRRALRRAHAHIEELRKKV